MKNKLLLSTHEENRILQLQSSEKKESRLWQRCEILLRLNSGINGNEVSRQLAVDVKTVHFWEKRFIANGVQGLMDKLRKGSPIRKEKLTLSPEIKKKLELLMSRPKTYQHLAQRAHIILECSRSNSDTEVADKVGASRTTVNKWRNRFQAEGSIECLDDAIRSGAPRKISDDQVEEIITKTLESKPEHKTHWSTRSMAKEAGVSNNSIARIWRAYGLKPHRTKNFKLSTDPYFVEKVRDIVGLYMNPPEHAIVICVDEKSQVQALDRTQPMLPLRPGQPERGTHDYVRNGTTSLFAALDIASGKVIGKCYKNHRHQEFLKFLNQIDKNIPKNMEVHIVMDNYATHKVDKVKAWFAKRPNYNIHFTPTSSSWINQIERWFAKITEERIRRGVFRSVKELENAISDYIEHNNKAPKPFIWTADADLILERVANVCRDITE